MIKCKNKLIDLQSSKVHYSTFISCIVTKFWCRMVEGFRMLTKRALEVTVLYFSRLHQCEARFSSLMAMKVKQQSCLVAKDDICVALSITAIKVLENVCDKQV